MNTPDTELHMKALAKAECAKNAGELTVVRLGYVVSLMEEARDERDTYWKERVRKTVGKIEESARTQDTSYEYGEGTYEGMMHSIFILKDITNEDNLK